jgi:antitoxin ParD1/3/4
MRTNIDIDDDLMAAAMAAGEFKTKREAVEEGLRLIKRRKAYADLLAARGTLFWDDSDAAWAKAREEAAPLAVAEVAATPYRAKAGASRGKGQKPAATKPAKRARGKSA